MSKLKQIVKAFVIGLASESICADVIPASNLPKSVQSFAKKAEILLQEEPAGWSSLTPWGQAIGKIEDIDKSAVTQIGQVEIKSIDVWCDVGGVTKKITDTNVANVGAGLYIKEPWFGGNDEHELIQPTKTTSGTWLLPVYTNKITHWWLSPRPYIVGASNCRITSDVKISNEVIVSIGGDYWITTTADWLPNDGANKAIGISSWYGYKDDWQTIVMDSPSSRHCINKYCTGSNSVLFPVKNANQQEIPYPALCSGSWWVNVEGKHWESYCSSGNWEWVDP